MKTRPADPAPYICRRTPVPVRIDGDLEKEPWRSAPRSRRFVDLVSGETALLGTTVACLWDDERFYVAYRIEEPQVQATLTERDSFIWTDNDVELFIAGDDCYYEFEINAFGTIYEAFFIWQEAHRRGSRFDRPEFDLYSANVDILGGFQDASRWGKHPRGRRWAFLDWDFPGLESAVRVQGTINDPTIIDRGWTVELALPWKGMEILFAEKRLPPRDGDILRCDFSRFQGIKLRGQPQRESLGWSLSPHGAWDSHLPERFSSVRFSSEAV